MPNPKAADGAVIDRPDSKSILLLSEMGELGVSKCSNRFGQRVRVPPSAEPEGRWRRHRPTRFKINSVAQRDGRELGVSKCSNRFGQTAKDPLTYANRQWPPRPRRQGSCSPSVVFASLCPEWKLASRRLKLMIQGARKKERNEGRREATGVDCRATVPTKPFSLMVPSIPIQVWNA